jgi:uncharacterized protein (TIGR03086 family)
MTSPAASDDLLEQAVGYALRSVAAVTPEVLTWPTPCAGWDLNMLLQHSCESLAALSEGANLGCVGQAAGANRPCADAAGLFTARARDLLDDWPRFCRPHVLIAGLRLAVTDFAAAGALEIAVHGWDVTQACGRPQPIPAVLAARLLAVAPLLVTDADREPRPGPGTSSAPLFGPALAVSPAAGASDRLTAFLGRTSARLSGIARHPLTLRAA